MHINRMSVAMPEFRQYTKSAPALLIKADADLFVFVLFFLSCYGASVTVSLYSPCRER